MSLEAILGIDHNSHHTNQLAESDVLRFDELDDDGRIKSELPMMFGSDKIKLPRTVDEYTRRDIHMKFKKGTTTLAFLYKGGICVCADSRATGGEYIASGTVQKIIPINQHLLGTMAGGAADCAYWERLLSERCRLYELRNRERISIAAASKLLVNMLYNYKGRGLSVGCMICGWDAKKGPKIYMVDNDAQRIPGNIFSVGSGSVYAYSVLDKNYRFDLSDEEACNLGRRAVYHATHRDAASGGIVRVYLIKEDGWKIISEEDMNILHDRFKTEKSIADHL